MTTKKTRAATLRATSSIAMWMIGAATFCMGLLAMLALVIVLATLMPAMVLAAATPAFAASAAQDPRNRFAHRPHLPQSPETNPLSGPAATPFATSGRPRARGRPQGR